MVFSTDALVLRSTDSGDYDRLLTLLTPEHGKIYVMAKGARSQKSRSASLTQPYVFVNCEIYRKNDMNWLRGGSVLEYFNGLRNDIEKLSLAAYLADIAGEVTGEYVPAIDILRMTLNSYYGINKEILPPEQIKAVYEWRTAGYAGYMPDMTCCRACRREVGESIYLDVMNGRLICSDCLRRRAASAVANPRQNEENYERSILVPMSAGAVAAVRFALTAMPERMFSFRIKDASDADKFCRSAEIYLLNHLERSFDSLEFYKILLK